MYDTDEGYNYEYVEATHWSSGYYIVWDGLHEAYGHTLDEAIEELHRNMGMRDDT